MLQPNRLKFPKEHKGRVRGIASSGSAISFGTFGLKSLSIGRLTARQLESARKVIVAALNRSGKVWIRVFPHTPITKKPAEVRMGSGKGGVEYYVAKVKPGTVLFEIDGVSDEIANAALAKALYKLPLKAAIVKRVY